MVPPRDDGPDDEAPLDQPDWRMSLARARASMRKDLGETSIDFVEIIREMRQERDIEIRSTLYSEEQAIAMVRGTPESSDDEDFPAPHS